MNHVMSFIIDSGRIMAIAFVYINVNLFSHITILQMSNFVKCWIYRAWYYNMCLCLDMKNMEFVSGDKY